jgi:hypothetical protein
MSATWVQTVGGALTSGGTGAITVANANDVLLLFIDDTAASGRSITIADSQSQTWTICTPPGALAGGSETQGLYYLIGAKVGLHTLTITGTSGDTILWACVEYTNVLATGAIDATQGLQQSAPGTGAGAIGSNPYNVTNANDTLVGISVKYTTNAAGLVASSGTQRSSTSVASSILVVVEDQIAGALTGVHSNFTDATNGGTDPYSTFSVALFPTGPSSPPEPFMSGRAQDDPTIPPQYLLAGKVAPIVYPPSPQGQRIFVMP